MSVGSVLGKWNRGFKGIKLVKLKEKKEYGPSSITYMYIVYFVFKFSSSRRTHMQDLKDMTNDNHYENYRCEKLAAMTVGSPTNQPSSK